MASPDIPSFRPQTAAPKPAVERGASLFHAKELTYSKEQLLALRPRSGAAVGATYDGDGLPSGVYSIDPLAPASQPGPLPQLKSVAPLPRRDAAGRGRGRGDEPFGPESGFQLLLRGVMKAFHAPVHSLKAKNLSGMFNSMMSARCSFSTSTACWSCRSR